MLCEAVEVAFAMTRSGTIGYASSTSCVSRCISGYHATNFNQDRLKLLELTYKELERKSGSEVIVQSVARTEPTKLGLLMKGM